VFFVHREICTQLAGQVRICYSSAKNPLQNITASLLNQTYSSLSSAQPSASAYNFDPAVLIAQTQPTLTRPVTATSSGVPPNAKPSPNHLSGGAIAGVVIGALAVAAIAGLAAILFLQHRKNNQNHYPEPSTRAPQPNLQPPFEDSHYHVPQEMQAIPINPVELPGTHNGGWPQK
jgi:hypothetical protein